jgi:hypothetical protein
MNDALDLLETIGQDASLRHATAEALAHALAQANAPEALTQAVALGEISRLSEEFGPVRNETMQTSNHPAREDEPDEEQPLEVPVPGKTPSPAGE